MHLHFEKSINAKCDCSILSMSWMGKVPDELPEEEGWKLNRNHYYQEGWLATGNLRGIVGVTFTSSHWRKNLSSGASANGGVSPGWLHDLPQRTNYNLRGHRSQITLVQWNEPYQKLASCDSSGIIFVWIKFEGRWSIELINDRSTPVTHFSWSHDGRMALICYRDGFVLVGSVAGQRYWSSMLNLNAIITCGLWSPSDQQVFLGTSNAQVIVMDVVHGMMISQVQMPMDSPILSMTWSCEKFKMEENEESIDPTVPQPPQPPPSYLSGASTSASTSDSQSQSQSQQQQQQNNGRQRSLLLAIAFQNGTIFLMRNYDDIAPIQIYTGMQQGLMMEWSNSGEILAVVGTRPVEVINEAGAKIHEYFSSLHFYNHAGVRVLNIVIPSTQWPVTALTWGHNDKRLFVATGQTIHVGWVAKRVASLQLLCRLTIYKALSNETCVSHLPLPLPVRTLISSLHTQTILSILPSDKDLLEFVSHPPTHNTRLHCTMIRHDEIWSQSPGTVYTLYLEYLGGLIPILKGKRTSKIRPHFVIYSPQGSTEPGSKPQTAPDPPSSKGKWHPDSPFPRHADHNASPFHLMSDSSDSEDVELCASPRLQRKRHRARMRERERERQRERELEWERNRDNNGANGQQPMVVVNGPPTAASSTLHLNSLDTLGLVPPPLNNQLVYNDVLPESLRLVEVTSNIWGTRFKIHGLESFPSNLGSLSYKTSVLHLQPRQMTCIITELTDDIFVNSTTSSTGIDAQGQTVHQHGSGSTAQQQLLDEVDDMFSIVVGSTNGAGPCTSNASYYNGGALDNSTLKSRYAKHMPVPVPTSSVTTSRDEESSYVEFVPFHPDPNPASCDRDRDPTTPTHIKRQLITHAALIERIDDATTSAATICTSPSIPGPSSILSHRGSVHSSPTRRRISWTKLQHQSTSPPLGSGEPSSSSSRSSGPTQGGSGSGAPESSPPPVQPLHVRRSISASFLDHVYERTLPTPVDMVDPDMMNPQSPPKRLVLVKELQEEEEEPSTSTATTSKRPVTWLKDCGKSKSWDFADFAKWKQQKSNTGTAHASKHPCPNCKFPSTQNKPHVYIHDYPAPILKPLPPLPPLPPTILKSNILTTARPSTAGASMSSSSSCPKTPARRLSAPKTPMLSRRRDSNEDRIERLAESPPPSSSTPTSTPPASPRHALSTSLNNNSLPPQTPNLQRRLSNFLTPILRRRDLFSCASGNSEKRKAHSAGGGNPSSRDFIPPDSPTHMAKPMSQPTTPATARKLKVKHQSYLAAASSPIRQFFANSPLLSRRKCNNNSQSSCTPHFYNRHNRQIIDSTDDEDDDNEIEIAGSRHHGEAHVFSRDNSLRTPGGSHVSRSMIPPATQAHHARSGSGTFRDLETFQKNQLRQKLRKKKIHNIDKSPVRPKRREFVLHNKAPMWNENSQVYQLDFGGRVTQESAKNFQIEFRGKQVMQFGRIDGNAYTLDFQYPFSALQAFGVALANVTQRLK